MCDEEKVIERINKLIEKAGEVLKTHDPNAGLGVADVDQALFYEWRTQVLNFLVTLLGKDSVYFQEFDKKVRGALGYQVKVGQGILRGLKEDIENGYIELSKDP